jgi:hypothetical protein
MSMWTLKRTVNGNFMSLSAAPTGVCTGVECVEMAGALGYEAPGLRPDY